ncbi:glycosyltransferase family 2 protein [Microbacterium sp. NPDC007973]|uniref:glycosyltransferase family 2 protein n=1 Tax=Microbacterium sp. NPDC007973 TaxID=3364182 RepID=UPI0036EE4653
MRLDADYVLPLRWSDDTDLDELTDYLHELVGWMDVTVVDGSPPPLFAAHARAFPRAVRHVAPSSVALGNGKACGVVTGLALAGRESVVIADDDVRHDRATLIALLSDLSDAELVAPQNVFAPAPWHARWDTARSLVNRGFGRDHPGTYAVRRSSLPHGYDMDVLFENLEMERTVRARGGRVRHRLDLYVRRLPPDTRQFLSQRVRQAYDSLAQPVRLCAELALAPAVVVLRRRPGILCLLAAIAVAVAERGRRRQHGAAVYPRTAALWAPLWAAERAVTSWLALALRVKGGVVYAGRRMRRSATPSRVLRRRVAGGRDHA